MSFDDFKNLVALFGALIGALAGAYALYQNWRKNKVLKEAEEATARANAEARRLADKTSAFVALESTVGAQQKVIEGLTKGLEDCIERDNAKAVEINELRTHDAEKSLEIAALKRKVAALEARLA